MKTTIRIDDTLLAILKEAAQREGLSMTKFIEKVLHRGLASLRKDQVSSLDYHEKTFSMGRPSINLDKAAALAVSLEDEQIHRKLVERK